ncbi:hypothetical protein HMPREF9441_01004 [Paraprevotella clara YIT 11840]|uniref:Uncharacterized protein n=1 Tax=Paraprevotella clara YIT 11840 TaxID=762968 RepID=G5SP09_9BACT|nr:hypothetical protein HMPREF9441_01004 [Paraprevotella clara YIT 11840]
MLSYEEIYIFEKKKQDLIIRFNAFKLKKKHRYEIRNTTL